MKFVMSAIVLLAFVFILTSCNLTGSALSGTGDARPPDYGSPYGGTNVQTSQPSLPICDMGFRSTGTLYIDIDTVRHILLLNSGDDTHLEVRILPMDGVLPSLAAVRYQAHPQSGSSSPAVVRALVCQSVGTSASTRDYTCTIPAGGNADDKSRFFMESLELKIDGYPSNFVFRTQTQDVTGGCTNRGDIVRWPNQDTLPSLNVSSAN